MMDEERFVKVLKEKERREREMERAELRKTLQYQVDSLKDACKNLKSQFFLCLKIKVIVEYLVGVLSSITGKFVYSFKGLKCNRKCLVIWIICQSILFILYALFA